MDPGTAIAVIDLSAKVLSLISKYYSDVKHAKSDIERLSSEIQGLDAVFQKFHELIQKSSLAKNLPTSASLNQPTEQALIDVKELESILNPGTGGKMVRRVGKRALKWPLAKKEVNDWVAKLERHKTLFNLALTTDQSLQIHDIDTNVAHLRLGREAEEQDRLLGKLHVADDAFFNSYHRQHESQCTVDTRVELLKQLGDWAAKHQRSIFWLSGMAGTGKSTIARTLAGRLNERNSLGGSFFFSRASGSSKNAANFVGTLAYALAKKSPQFMDRICEAISGNGDVLRQGLRNQWEELIIGPLSKVKLVPRPTMTFIIDALDEYGSDDEIRLILQLFVEVKSMSAIDLGVFVTSRPEIAVRLGFEKVPEIVHQNLDLRDIPRHTVEHDVAVFLRRELGRISQEHKIPDWPSRDNIQSLVQRANGLFIYAATVCGFVDDKNWDPQERLSEILRGGSAEAGGTVQLDEMYSEVLRCALTKGRREGEVIKLCDRFKQVVGSIITLSDTLSISALAKLLDIPIKNVELALGTLHSVLNIPKDSENPIRLLHPSFHDFLSDEARCEDRRFFVEKVSIHGKLFINCLEVMSAALKRNVCNLQTPGSSPQDVQRENLFRHLPQHVQYACQYWVEHLACASSEQWIHLGLRDGGIIHEFFQRYYLYWLEAMSLLGKISDAVLMVAKVGEMLKNDKNPALYSLVADANRFNLSNRAIIDEAPLQVYAAALVFSPRESVVRTCYQEHFPTWLIRLPSVEDRWGPSLQILEGHTEPVTAVAFSPDGKYLASASLDLTVRLWDPMTGALRSTLAGHSGIISAVAFSSNCQVATVSQDSIVRIWDPVSGVTRHVFDLEDLEYTPERYFRMAFAPNGSLVIGSSDGRLHTWDLETANLNTVNFSGSDVDSLAFSPQGNLLFSRKEGRKSQTLSYEPDTGITHHIFPFTTISLAFSSDNRIALALGNGTIALCSRDSPSILESLGILGAPTVTTTLAFSPDNNFLIAGSWASSSGTTLRSWNLSTHTEGLIGTVSSMVNDVTFSPDGRQLAFNGHVDKTVHLWDPSTENADKIREGHSTIIRSLILSHDGKQLASIARDDHVIRIWYPVSGKLHHALTGHSGYIFEVVFSHDSRQMASSSEDGTLRLWDPVGGTFQHVLKPAIASGIPTYGTYPDALVYAKDGKELACGYRDGAIRIWNPANGDLIQTLEGHSSGVRMAAFSPNGRVLASTCRNGILIIWDRVTGDPLQKLENGRADMSGLAFSPDSQYLACILSGKPVVAMWDVIKGDLWKTLEVHHVWIGEVALSPDNQLLAVSTWNGITVVHLATGGHLETFHIKPCALHLSFSADGTYLDTDHGELEIGYLLEDAHCSSPLSRFRWSIRGDWLMQDSRKMLWLPPDFRPEFSAYRDGFFVLGRKSGEISFMEVDLNYRPPE